MCMELWRVLDFTPVQKPYLPQFYVSIKTKSTLFIGNFKKKKKSHPEIKVTQARTTNM